MSFKRHSLRILNFIPLLAVIFLMTSITPIPLSANPEKDLPERSIYVAAEFPGVVTTKGEEVSVDIIVSNRGRRPENVFVTLSSIPDGWKTRIKTYKFGVTGVNVGSDDLKTLTLVAEPDKKVGPGKYTFIIQGKTEDGKLTSTSRLIVTVEEKKAEKIKPRGLNIVTSYPVLKGPTDASFEFSIEVENKLDKDALFNLSAKGPENWDINFKPAYDDKLISSLRLKAGQSQSVAIAVKPYVLTTPGEYPIAVKINSPEAQGEVELTVVLTGTYKMDLGTINQLLSLNAVRGKEANISLYVKNSGSAVINDVQFLSFKPENWEVKFDPESIDNLQPQDVKQVEVAIKPANQALVGDYSVGLSAEAGKINESLEMRVTVKASTAWGWIGIGIILLVVAGLVFLFMRLGRR
jgi:uncharacterized membrane protein